MQTAIQPFSDTDATDARPEADHRTGPRVINDKHVKNMHINPDAVFRILADDYNLCWIHGDLAVLNHPARHPDCDGMYGLGDDALVGAIFDIVPDMRRYRSTREFYDVAKKVRLMAADDPEVRHRIFESTRGITILRDCALKVTLYDGDAGGCIRRLDSVDPDDHVVRRAPMPFGLRPSSLDAWHAARARMARVILDWADGDPARADRIVEAVFSGLMMPTPRITGAAYLYGSGSCGKSTCIDLMRLLVGDANVFSTSLATLADTHVTSGLRNKRVLVCDENSSATLKPAVTSLLRSITNGRDVACNPKYEKVDARFDPVHTIIASNHPFAPPKGDADAGPWRRRICPIQFRHTFLDGGKRTRRTRREWEMDDLAASIAADPDNMSALLSLAIEGVQRLLTDGVTEVPADDALLDEWLDVANAVEVFVRECGIAGQELPDGLSYMSTGGYGAGLLVAPIRCLGTIDDAYLEAVSEDVSAYLRHEDGATRPDDNVYDLRRGTFVNYKADRSVSDRVADVGFFNAAGILYRRYVQWEQRRQGSSNAKGVLSDRRFFQALSRLGYHSVVIKTRFSTNPHVRHSVRVYVPDIVKDMDDLRQWIKLLTEEYAVAHRVESCPAMDEVVSRHGTESPDVDLAQRIDATVEKIVARGEEPTVLPNGWTGRDPFASYRRLELQEPKGKHYARLSVAEKNAWFDKCEDIRSRETQRLCELRDAMLGDTRTEAQIYASYGLVDADDADRLGIPCPTGLQRDALDAIAKHFSYSNWAAKCAPILPADMNIAVIDVAFELLHGAGLGTDENEDVAVGRLRNLWPCTDATNDSGALDLRLRASFAYVHVRARDLLLERSKRTYNVTVPDCEDPAHAFADGDALSDIQDAGGLLRPVYHWGADEGDIHGPRCQDERFLRIFQCVLSYDRNAIQYNRVGNFLFPYASVAGGAHGPRLHLEALRRHDK